MYIRKQIFCCHSYTFRFFVSFYDLIMLHKLLKFHRFHRFPCRCSSCGTFSCSVRENLNFFFFLKRNFFKLCKFVCLYCELIILSVAILRLNVSFCALFFLLLIVDLIENKQSNCSALLVIFKSRTK